MDNPEFTVYFRGFPEEMDDRELGAIFAAYGNIVKYFVHKTRYYGMVEFKETRSCHDLINTLHGAAPLNMYLSMVNRNTNQIAKYSSHDKFTKHSAFEEQEVFVDENGSVVNVIRDPVNNEIYVPVRYAKSIQCIQRKDLYVAHNKAT